jgi:hypothetical protein
MKQTTYKVVIPDDQNLVHESANFDHESEARTYARDARAAAQSGRGALVLKIETEILASYPPETLPGTPEDKQAKATNGEEDAPGARAKL